jgi:hypothetical protein
MRRAIAHHDVVLAPRRRLCPVVVPLADVSAVCKPIVTVKVGAPCKLRASIAIGRSRRVVISIVKIVYSKILQCGARITAKTSRMCWRRITSCVAIGSEPLYRGRWHSERAQKRSVLIAARRAHAQRTARERRR